MDTQMDGPGDSNALMPAPEVSLPSIPQNQVTTLVEGSVSPVQVAADDMGIPMARSDRSKYTSPAPPTSSSMTPPPSSQIASQIRTVARTPTPPTPHLSSPPPTNGLVTQPGPVSEGATVAFTKEQIADATPEELRTLVDELANALKEARMSAAHYKLQYNMQCLDSTEAQNRMAVELEMAQKEIDVLQRSIERQQGSIVSPAPHPSPSVNPANAILINELSRHCHTLQRDKDNVTEQLANAKRVVEHKVEELRTAYEENDRLRGRIRKNREHMNNFLEITQDGSPPRHRVNLGTPVTPRHRPTGRMPVGDSGARRDQQPFEALLLADKVLSQETATTPSTPTKAVPRNRIGHTRGTHSMSSLPSTPNRHRAAVPSALFATPPSFPLGNRVPMSAPSTQHYVPQQRPRRDSSASTITASSVEQGYSDDEVPESQASRAASSLLRSSSQPKSFESQRSAGLVQTKLFGQVKKAGVQRHPEQEKRRLSGRDPISSSPSKKSRYIGEVGLGIGGIANSRN